MIAFKELKDVLQKTVEWEKKLNDLYDVASFGLVKDDSKKLITFLKDRQESNLEILEGIDVKSYGPSGWVRFAADYREDELIPNKVITRESSPKQILDTILEYGEKLRDFYKMISEHVVSERQRDLFDSLSRFKEEQTNRIRNFARSG
ncbi:MAG: hypothetical protein CMN78_05865 [Spirochaetales bacterium]|nr:hypothetical protein [Spirochaetales bacterium]